MENIKADKCEIIANLQRSALLRYVINLSGGRQESHNFSIYSH